MKSYGNRDIKRIIETALRIQQRESGGATGENEPTIEDVVGVGQELGVPRDIMLRAAREVETRRAEGPWRAFLGGELVQEAHATVQGRVSEEHIQELAADLSRIIGVPGRANMVGRRLSWQTSYFAAQQRAWMLTVGVGVSGNTTSVDVEGHNGYLAGGLFGGLLGGVGVGAGLGVGLGVGIGELGSALFAVIVPLLALGGSYLLARALFRAISRSRRRRIERACSELREILAGSLEDGEQAPPPDED